MTIEKKIKDLSRHVAKLYFVDRDYENLLPYLAEDITWIGTGEKEICMNKKEACRFFEKEIKIFDGNFDLINQWYECKQIEKNICYIMAVIKIKLNNEKAVLGFDTLRFNGIWKKEDDGMWRIIHIHNSLPDGGMCEETYFNLSLAKSNYTEIHETIRKASTIDMLTKINNEQGFIQEVETILQKYPNQKYAIIKFGIRHFRFVNRRYGFAVGDDILTMIATNLCKTLQNGEACGRIESDNFAILCHFQTQESLESQILKTQQVLLDKEVMQKLDISIELKTGVYIINDNKEYVKGMLDKALLALRSMNDNATRKNLAYFEDHMLEQKYFNSRILKEAPKAMKNDEFVLYMQPQFDIYTKKIVACEALVRWRSQDGSLRMPNDFIPIFEMSRVILAFDIYMLEKICKQVRQWLDQGLEVFPISINQSRLHIQEKNYLKTFFDIVDKYRIPHDLIMFELTESAFIEDSDKMLELAMELHQNDFQLAIDDFGTGYASLNLLAEISADVLKLDRILLNNYDVNIRTRVIIESMINLAHALDMQVVAEGVETEKQLEFLRKVKCDIGQGYLISNPLEANEFMDTWGIKKKETVYNN